METKECTKCKMEMPKTNEYFPKREKSKDGFDCWCKTCKKKADKARGNKYYLANKERRKEYYQENKERIKQISKEYYHANWEKQRAWEKNYRQENKEKLNAYANAYIKKLYKEEPDFKIMTTCRIRISQAIQKGYKSAQTTELIGCSIKHLMKHLEEQFDENMNWDNYGEWHVDHIIPVASFDLTKKEEQSKCFNYKNLQPLWALDNILKSDKII